MTVLIYLLLVMPPAVKNGGLNGMGSHFQLYVEQDVEGSQMTCLSLNPHHAPQQSIGPKYSQAGGGAERNDPKDADFQHASRK